MVMMVANTFYSTMHFSDVYNVYMLLYGMNILYIFYITNNLLIFLITLYGWYYHHFVHGAQKIQAIYSGSIVNK